MTEAEELELLQLERERELSQSAPSIPSPAIEKKTTGLFGTSLGENSELLRKARIPAETSRRGLKMMTDAIPDAETPSFWGNMGRNTPKMLAEIGSEFSAGMLDPETAISAGTLKALPLLSKPANSIGRFVGETAEKMSGLSYRQPGVLADTVKDPGLIWGTGKQAAGKLYDKVKDSGVVREALKFVSDENPSPLKPALFIRRAMQFVKDGSINPKEALKARQALDAAKDQFADDAFRATRDIFDKIAKQKYKEADEVMSKAFKSDALRNFWGINKGQTPSLLKQGISLAYPMTGPFFSPVAQGHIAAGIGLGKGVGSAFVRNPVQSAILASPAIEKLRKKE